MQVEMSLGQLVNSCQPNFIPRKCQQRISAPMQRYVTWEPVYMMMMVVVDEKGSLSPSCLEGMTSLSSRS